MFVGVSKAYRFFETYLGIHVTYPHFYSPLPTLKDIDPNHFTKLFACKGVDFNFDVQNELLTEFLNVSAEYVPQKNQGLSLVDAFVLYAQIRRKKPNVMIEIGSGESTRIALKALNKNLEEGHDFRFRAIEPYPPKYLESINDPRFELIISKVQDVEVSKFSDADILFIDSSHVSKLGSDVNYEILEIVPTLKQGCLVHWHDIFFPKEYPKEWMETGQQFWNESYMLHAFLSFNDSFKIRWSSKYLQTYKDELLKEKFSYYQSSHNLSSLWVERIR